MTVALVPDIERIASDYLKYHADIIALSTRIVGKTPDAKTTSWVRVTKIGGGGSFPADHLAASMVQFGCYAGGTGGQPEATTLGRTVRGVLATLPGIYGTGTVTGVEIVDDSRDSDTDFEPARERVVLTAMIWCHA